MFEVVGAAGGRGSRRRGPGRARWRRQGDPGGPPAGQPRSRSTWAARAATLRGRRLERRRQRRQRDIPGGGGGGGASEVIFQGQRLLVGGGGGGGGTVMFGCGLRAHARPGRATAAGPLPAAAPERAPGHEQLRDRSSPPAAATAVRRLPVPVAARRAAPSGPSAAPWAASPAPGDARPRHVGGAGGHLISPPAGACMRRGRLGRRRRRRLPRWRRRRRRGLRRRRRRRRQRLRTGRQHQLRRPARRPRRGEGDLPQSEPVRVDQGRHRPQRSTTRPIARRAGSANVFDIFYLDSQGQPGSGPTPTTRRRPATPDRHQTFGPGSRSQPFLGSQPDRPVRPRQRTTPCCTAAFDGQQLERLGPDDHGEPAGQQPDRRLLGAGSPRRLLA